MTPTKKPAWRGQTPTRQTFFPLDSTSVSRAFCQVTHSLTFLSPENPTRAQVKTKHRPATMPGLTIITDGTQATPASGVAHGSEPGSAPQLSNPSSRPQPQQQQQQQQQQQPPPPTANTTTPRQPSPTRPPISPITPKLDPAKPVLPPHLPKETPIPPPTIPDFSLSRPLLSHISQAAPAATILPPQPVPLDFDSNPDVLALKSAISILQLQRQRAQADIQSLHKAKLSALSDPAAFVADLTSGKVGQKEEGLFGGSAPSDSGDDDDDDDDDEETKKQKDKEEEPAWRKLPKPQTVVRCPPINWNQYAVVGESLDKLHAEQRKAPMPGVPVVMTGTSQGTFEFTAGAGGQSTAGLIGSNQPQKLVGIAAPYAPGRDKIEKKRGGKRS
ncbi:hypothetical protein QBC36DRAFT_352756 [Triangularia setosa]|uniref:Uncharacterized protein n=1 Tax=Triangularia setosa TaxID=2587417 RepID=A0AAN6W6H7_9PEZI|nr:hypothetical protein QBC36DRAFT_352756 [Podospora setosa]